MVISKEKEADILRLFHADHWPVGTVARELGIHHDTVERVLAQTGVPMVETHPRGSIVDPYVPFILETLGKHPEIRASRLWQMCRDRGYSGCEDHFRHRISELRPRKAPEAFLRLRTLPGEQAQMDWGDFGKVRVGSATRTLIAFVLVLSFCRAIFLRFFLDARVPTLVRGHVEAFSFFGGVARRILYDNPRTVVLDRRRDAIRFHPRILELSGHYRFEARPVAVRRGNEKGRVERAIRTVRENFFAGRKFRDLETLNQEAHAWSTTWALDRAWPDDRSRSVREVFEEEKRCLVPLPKDPFPANEVLTAAVGKTPYVRFDLNDYSVPHRFVRTEVTVVASLETVRVLDPAGVVVAEHARSFDRQRQIEDPAHVAALVAQKAAARGERSRDRLYAAAPNTDRLMVHLAEQGKNLGAATSALLRLLDHYGAAELERAVSQALDRGTPHVGAVRQILDQDRSRRGLPPPVGVELPEGSPHKGLVVKPHALRDYDDINSSTKETFLEHEDTEPN